jgi:hypothetical protein
VEKDFKKKVKRDLDKLPHCWYFVKEAGSIRGLPDIVGLNRGRFFALELKKEKVKLNGRAVLQDYVLKKIRSYGGFAEFTYPENWESIYTRLDNIS